MLVKKLRAALAARLQHQIEGSQVTNSGGGGDVVSVIARLLEEEEAVLQRDK